MQGFNINEVAAPASTVVGQVVPPTGGGGWAVNCQPGIDGTTPDADFFNDLIGNILRVIQAAGITPTPDRYDDLLQAIELLIGTLAATHGDAAYDAKGSADAVRQALNSAVQNLQNEIDALPHGSYVTEAELQSDVNNLQTAISGKAPIRNGASPTAGYVITDTDNTITLNWNGSGFEGYTDGQDQGVLLTSLNYQSWAAPRTEMDLGGIGSYTIWSASLTRGQLTAIPGLAGTWKAMSANAIGNDGMDWLLCRIS